MNTDQARSHLESIAQRIERDSASGKLKLTGVVSELEYQAISTAIEILGGSALPSISSSRFVPVSKNDAAPLALQSLQRSSPDEPEVLLCLDFGTAMSKAAATINSDDRLIEIELGRRAGANTGYGLHSSVFVSRSGRIYFGHEALAKSGGEFAAGGRRFDSMKQRLSQGKQTDLAGDPGEALNPTNVPLTEGDLITLYLAYLTDMATTELSQGSPPRSRYVRRRFARPCWDVERVEWFEGKMRLMLAKAQILADTFSGSWSDGLPANIAKATVDAVNALDQLPEYLIMEGVPEPVAAASSRLITTDRDRGMFVVVDVGAGTTDFAAFWANQDPERELYTVWQIRGTVDGLAQAGDSIDGYLQSRILELGHLRSGTTDYNYAAARLSQDIRQYKEDLFLHGALQVVLTNSTTVKITLGDFLEDGAMQDFAKLLLDRFLGVLTRADKSWIEEVASLDRVGRGYITVVLTGGGAGLPVVTSLAKQVVEVHGRKLECRPAANVPEWLADNYPRLRDVYPRLAVAIGGAARRVPELAPETATFSAAGTVASWHAATAYKS